MPRNRQDRLDADERVGRADHHRAQAAGPRSAARTSGCDARRGCAVVSAVRSPPARSAAARNSPGSRASLRAVRRRVRTAVVGHRHDARRDAEPAAEVGGDGGQALAGRSRRVRSTWVARSPSPSWNQVSPPSAASAAMKVQVSSRRPQPRCRIVEPGEHVHQRVEIGRDRRARDARSRRRYWRPPAVRRAAGRGSSPSASLAPPTPPDSATTRVGIAAALTGTDPRRRDGSGGGRRRRRRPGQAAHQDRRPRLVRLVPSAARRRRRSRRRSRSGSRAARGRTGRAARACR